LKTSYNIVATGDFHQPNPPHVCRDWALHVRLSAALGYQSKCRDPRCSLACLQHWRAKQAHILRRLFTHHLPDDATCYRGHVKLKDGATLEDHSHVVGKFFKAITRHAKRRAATIQVHLTAHITAPNDMHHDMLVYSDLPKTVLRSIVKTTWKNVGGYKCSVPELDTEEEKIKAAKYTMKDTTAAKKEYRYLPGPNYNLTRYTSGFWSGTTAAGLWKELLQVWFPKPTEPDCVPIRNSQLYDTCPTPETTPNPLHKTDSKLRDMALSYLQQFTPRREDKALSLHELSTALSIPTTWLQALMPHDPMIRRDGHNKFWRDPLQDPSNANGVAVASSPPATIPDDLHVLAA
jgi:hypothetical protein